ncbi:MAG: malate synthase A [Desulfobacteraceae bacterium]|nr:malate synthase A [Desulfobacteraceae bacterium]
MTKFLTIDDIEIKGPLSPGYDKILTPEALRFAANLHRRFNDRRLELLNIRQRRQKQIDKGNLPGFLPKTKKIRQGDWKIAPVPEDLQDRRVEITGPVKRKMIINALNSGATTFMADFEDSLAPTWDGIIQGQLNLIDAVEGTITYNSPDGKKYQLNEEHAVLIVRPRGWHLDEKHVHVGGAPFSGSIFDFALYFFHNAHELLKRGSGPYFYLPKLESHLEARLWNDIFLEAQKNLNLHAGTIKATVLIDTILAIFETEEILYELREHAVGLNCGRWNYIFSFIKRFRNVPGYIFPDRSLITMTRYCMRSYTIKVIQTSHRRGAHAIGGITTRIPIKDDSDKNQAALDKVREDKTREAEDGHDGTWVAHPDLVAVARDEFDRVMPARNQIHRLRENINVAASDLLMAPKGAITENGLRNNVSVAIQYFAHWLSGNGCVPLYNLMEAAGTAEIARAQVWQWIHHPEGVLDNGKKINLEMVQKIIGEEMESIRKSVDQDKYRQIKYDKAAELFEQIISDHSFEEFFTVRAYKQLD